MVKITKVKTGALKPMQPFKTLGEEVDFWDSHSVVDKIDKGTVIGFHQANKSGTTIIRKQTFRII